jgi:hypothetical protein
VLTTLLNPIVWLLVTVFVAAALAARRGARVSDVLDPIVSLARRPAVCAVLILAAGLTAGPRVVLGYLAPGGYAEEVVAARALLAGNGTRTTDDGEAFRRWIAEEPAPVMPWTLPGLSSCQANALESRGHFFTAQGHTPFLLLASVPVVAALGGRGSFVMLTLFSLGALLLTAARIARADPARNGVALVSTAALLACWQPVLATLRQGDVALLVTALIVVSWDALDRGLVIRAGVAAGLAGSISAGALLLVLVAFAYSRRAGLIAMMTVVLATGASAAIAGPLVLIDYIDAVRATNAAYGATPFNYTLVGRFPWSAGVLTLAVAGTLIRVVRSTRTASSASDWVALGVAAAAAAVPLLSPVAWSQQLVVLALPAAVMARAIRSRGAAWLCLLALLLLATSLPDRPVAWVANVLLPGGLLGTPVPLPLVATLVFAGWLLMELRRVSSQEAATRLAA